MIFFYCAPSEKQIHHEYHLGVGYIQAFLKQKGIPSKQIVPKEMVSVETVIDLILENSPKIVGLTCYDSNYSLVKIISEKIKRVKQDIVLFAGGPSATFSSQFILDQCPDVDLCVRGEGEITCYELLLWMKGKKQLDTIKGVSYRNDKKIVHNENRSFEKSCNSLDYFPSPYLEGIPVEHRERIIVLTSRGCPYKCVYCNFPGVTNHSLRFHSVERVIGELEYIQNTLKYTGTVLIGDELFTANKKRSLTILREIMKRGIKLRLLVETRADFLDYELLSTMKQAGVFKVNFGLESSSVNTLKRINKLNTRHLVHFKKERAFLEKIKESVQLCKELGIAPMVNIITGLPGETQEESQETLEFVRQLDIPNYSHNILRIFKGTELFHSSKQFNIQMERSESGLPYSTQHHYDVSQVVPLDNSNLKRDVITEINIFKKLLSNTYEGSRYSVILYNFGSESGDLINKNCPVNSTIIKYSNHPCNKSEEMEWRKLCIEKKICSNKLHFLWEYDNTLQYRFHMGYEQKAVFQKIRLSDLNQNQPEFLKKRYIITIENSEDLKSLKELIDQRRSPFQYPNCTLYESCRWGIGKCQKGKILCHLKDISFSPCRSWADNNNNTEILESSVTKECHLCPASENCPQCSELKNISRDEYCSFMKNYLHRIHNLNNNPSLIENFITFLKYENRYTNSEIEEMENCLVYYFSDGKIQLNNVVIDDIKEIIRRKKMKPGVLGIFTKSIYIYLKFQNGFHLL